MGTPPFFSPNSLPALGRIHLPQSVKQRPMIDNRQAGRRSPQRCKLARGFKCLGTAIGKPGQMQFGLGIAVIQNPGIIARVIRKAARSGQGRSHRPLHQIAVQILGRLGHHIRQIWPCRHQAGQKDKRVRSTACFGADQGLVPIQRRRLCQQRLQPSGGRAGKGLSHQQGAAGQLLDAGKQGNQAQQIPAGCKKP